MLLISPESCILCLNVAGTSNFTQLVWRGSRCLGVGLASFPHRHAYVIVTQYLPPGNVNTATLFSDNVPPPLQADT